MGALRWRIRRGEGLVVVSGVGVFDFDFFVDYRKAMQVEGIGNYRKLFDLRRADIVLSPHDLDRMLVLTQSDRLTAGPIAIMMGRNPAPLLVDMAQLLQHRMGPSRRMRLFVDEVEARRWLANEPISGPG